MEWKVDGRRSTRAESGLSMLRQGICRNSKYFLVSEAIGEELRAGRANWLSDVSTRGSDLIL